MTFITCIGPDTLEVHNSLPFRSDEEKQDKCRFESMKVLLYWPDRCYLYRNVTSSTIENKNLRNQSLFTRSTASSSGNVWIFFICELTNEMISDRLVCGIADNSVRRSLLQDPKLSPEKCLDICRLAEATSAPVKVISGQSSSTGTSADNINAVHKRRK